MAQDTEDRSVTDGNRLGPAGEAGSLTDFIKKWNVRKEFKEWENCKVYKVRFEGEEGYQIIVSKGSLKKLKDLFSVDEEGMVKPELLEIKYPLHQIIRVDRIISCIEVLPGDMDIVPGQETKDDSCLD